MSIVQRMRKQTAVYWEYTGRAGDGRPKYATPIQIKCRWSGTQTGYKDKEGQTLFSNGTVYVDRTIVLNSFLWLGLLADAPSVPEAQSGAVSVLYYKETPSLRNLASKLLRTVLI